jgi:sugar lactone lactonase YvrE
MKGVMGPKIIPLPDGWGPEGIAVGRDSQFFVGSIWTGAIYTGDLRTGAGQILVPPRPGERLAVGLAYDRRSDNLFVAGAFSGQGYVYDASTGADAGVFQLNAPGSLINDVVVTLRAAFFTDSFRPVLYRLPLGPAGELPGSTTVEEVPLGGDYLHVLGPNVVNANGIDATPDGEWLLVVNWATGLLYRVDPLTGFAMQVDLGGDTLLSADGILLDGSHTLYVVQSFLNQIAVVELDHTLLTGTIVDIITSPDFRFPSTVAEFGNRLYPVNARFDVAPPDLPTPPGLEFEVVAADKK